MHLSFFLFFPSHNSLISNKLLVILKSEKLLNMFMKFCGMMHDKGIESGTTIKDDGFVDGGVVGLSLIHI